MSYCGSLFPVVRLNIFFTPDRGLADKPLLLGKLL